MPRMPARAHRIHVMRFHLPARDHVVMDWAPALYMIRVDGHLGAMALSAFPGMTPQQKGTHTVLTGWLDQSALYGVLAEMEALGLVLLEVRHMEPHGVGALRMSDAAFRRAGQGRFTVYFLFRCPSPRYLRSLPLGDVRSVRFCRWPGDLRASARRPSR